MNYKEVKKYHIKDLNAGIHLLDLLKSNEVLINKSNSKKYIKNLDFVEVGRYKFYPVVIDVEVLSKEKLFLLGVFFPNLKTYYTLEIGENSEVEYIKYVKKNINELFNYIKSNSFVNYKAKDNKEGYQFLVGHNVVSYDLMVLFYVSTSSLEDSGFLINVISFSNYLIEDDSNKKNNNFYNCLKECKEFYKNGFLIDTLRCVPEDKARSLFRFKTELFFFNKNYKIAPLEFDFEGVADDSVRGTSTGLYEYNYNDLYYTWLLVFDKRVRGRLESRGLLYSNFDITTVGFAEALINTDARMNTEYISTTLNINRSCDYISNKSKKVLFSQLTFLYNYKYLKEYENLFGDENLASPSDISDKNINFKNISLKVGVGGLHSRQWEVKKKDKRGFAGTQMLLGSSDEQNLIVMLDFQSFYVNLILQLWDKIDPNNQENVLLNELNNIRLKLKKANDPNDIIFKISTLAYTGCLNSYTSRVYNPHLYYSMTINGQLVMLEFLYSICEIIESVVEVNTDGVVINIKKSNYDELLNHCDSFEKKYKFKIDTRDIIDMGLFFSSNKKIFFLKNEKIIKKGYGKYLSFNFEEYVYIHWLKKEVNNIKKIATGYMSRGELLSSLWQSFNSVIKDAISNEEIHIFFSAHTVLKTKTVVYFSKTPSNYGGLPTGGRTFLHPHPIKTLEFQNTVERESLYKGVIGDLDISSYWYFFLQKFSKHFIYTLNQDLEKHPPIVLENPHMLFWDSHINFFNFYKKNKSIFNIFCNLNENGFFCFFKDRDKKSFAKTKMVQTKLSCIYDKNKIAFSEYMFKNYTLGMVEGVAIAANLQDSWANDICCLDFDNFEELFSDEKFDETSNFKHKNFIRFLLSIKKNGIFIYSSPTNTPFDRFKIFFKFKNKPTDLSYNQFKKSKEYVNNNYGFNIEDFASIVGVSMVGLELLPLNKNYSLSEIEFDKFKNFFVDEKSNDILQSKDFKNSTYEELLIELFEERGYRERKIYNKSLKADGLKKVHVFDEKKTNINTNSFDNVFIGVLKKNNKMNLNLNDLNSLKQYYTYPYNEGMHRSIGFNFETTPENNYASDIKKGSKNKGIVIADIRLPESVDPMPSDEYLKRVKNISTANFSFSSLSIENKVLVLDQFIEIINSNIHTNFIFDRMEDETLIYHSECVFDKIPDNPKQVTMYVKSNGVVNINCFHEKCKLYNKYSYIAECLNKNLYAFILLNNKTIFKEVDLDVGGIFHMISNNNQTKLKEYK